MAYKFVAMLAVLATKITDKGLGDYLSMTDIRDLENPADICASACMHYDPLGFMKAGVWGNPAAPRTNPDNVCYKFVKHELFSACGVGDSALGDKLVVFDCYPIQIPTTEKGKRISAGQISGVFETICKAAGLDPVVIKSDWDACIDMMHEELGICEDARFAFGQEATKQLKAKYEISLLCGIQHPEATKNAIAGLAQKIRAGDASVKDKIWCIPGLNNFKESDEVASRFVSILKGENVTCNLYMGVYNNNASDIEFVRDLHRKNCVELWLKKSQHEKFEWYLRMKKFTGGNWDTAVDGLLMRDDGDVASVASQAFVNSLSPENFASAVSAACSLWQKDVWAKKTPYQKYEFHVNMNNFTAGNWTTVVGALEGVTVNGVGDATSEVFINSLTDVQFRDAVSAAFSLHWDGKGRLETLQGHRDLNHLTTASWSAAVSLVVFGVAGDVDVWTSEYVDGMSDADFDEALEIAKKSKVARLQHAINSPHNLFTRPQAFPDMSDEEIEALTEEQYKDRITAGKKAAGQEVIGTQVERTRARREAEKVLDASGRPVHGKYAVNPNCDYKTDKSNSTVRAVAHFKTCACCRDFAVGVQSGEVTIEGEWPSQRSVLNWAIKAQKGGVQFGERINELPPSKSTLRRRKAAASKAPAKKART